MTPRVTALARPPRVEPAPAPLPPRAPERPPHPEFGQLRPFHNYYRVVSVEPLRHHFVAWYHDAELVTAFYEVPPEPGAAVEYRGESFGLITETPPRKPMPLEAGAMAAAVKRDLIEHHEAPPQEMQLEYLGLFRRVVIEEISIRPREGYDRHYTLTKTLAADEALTSLRPAPMAFDSGGSSTRYGSPDAPQWIDAGPGRQGKAQLWKLFNTPSAFEPAVRARFEQAILAAARRVVRGEEGPRLGELRVERDAQVIPDDRETAVPVVFYVNLVSQGRQQIEARTWIHPIRAFGGLEHAEFELSAPCDDGRECRFTAEFALLAPPLPKDQVGERDVPLELHWQIRGPRRAGVRSGVVAATARVFLDGDRAVFLSASAGVPQQDFAGLAQYSAFEAHLGFMGDD